MLDPFIIRALLAGLGVATIASSIGCFVIWRRMAYFGDSLAHSALLGVALGLAIGMNTNLTVFMVCVLFAGLLLILQRKNILAIDTLLGILAHSSLSIGMVVISLMSQRINLHAYLFGDILTVTQTDIMWIYLGGFCVLALLYLNWSKLVLATLSPDLAAAEKVTVAMMNLLLTMLMTIVVAVSIRVVGILLISSLLIIPAATARQMARSPLGMAIFAMFFGNIAVLFGLMASLHLDTPSGPSIVVAAAMIFMVFASLKSLFRIDKL